MALYIILLFAALCAGMALSVCAFGTGGKRKHIFRDIYFSVEDTDGIGVLYTKTGEYSAVLKIENPVQKYCADIDSYYEFTQLFTALAQTLGEGYALHKQDIFVRRRFAEETGGDREFLSEAYFRYFEGRPYTDSMCYLTVTQEAKKSRLFSYDGKKWRDFLVKIRKVHDQLRDGGVQARFLNKAEASEYVDRYFAMDFKNRIVSMTNFRADEDTVSMGGKRCKVYSLVDVDYAALPSLIRPYTNIEVNNTEMPVDLVSVIDNIPNADTVVYNQVIFLPNQKRELSLLDKKKNRHASIPNPNNQMAVEDISRVQEVIARESKQLVYTHFNMMVAVDADTDLQKCTNHLENAFGRMGIHISKHAYNQLELFVGSFPGNCYALSEEYDRFLTLSDAAICLMYKERVQHSEETPLKIYYTDRQGVPVAIDITGKEGKNKLTDNSNFFCLGPSGSGKSFHMNHLIRHYYEQGAHVLLIDTGNSYKGLCELIHRRTRGEDGIYLNYTDEAPICFNPFYVEDGVYDVEKRESIKTLILTLWKREDEAPTRSEEVALSNAVNLYLTKIKSDPAVVPSFDTFYEFVATDYRRLLQQKKVREKDFDWANFLNVLEPFYRGGEYDYLLNSNRQMDLLHKRFIVFELDNISENRTLLPVVTIIIMETFLAKMRRLQGVRKVLLLEEAWKAIAKEGMASYVKYLCAPVQAA